MSRTRFSDILALISALLVVVGLTVLCRSGASATVATDPSTPIDHMNVNVDDYPSVLFIGDSYAAGDGLSEMSYGCMAAVRMRWLCNVAAVPGTGYMSGGSANRFAVSSFPDTSTSFAERIPHLAELYKPDVVVLDGGRNDLFPPTESVFKAMEETLGGARRAWPDAAIVFVRPRSLAQPADDLGFDDAFMARLRAKPSAADVVFLDPISELAGTDTSSTMSDDGIRPNRQGEVALSSVLVQSLLAQSFAPTN